MRHFNGLSQFGLIHVNIPNDTNIIKEVAPLLNEKVINPFAFSSLKEKAMWSQRWLEELVEVEG